MDRVMRLLGGGIALALAATAHPAAASVDRWQGFIAEAAQRFSIPEGWIAVVMRSESGGDPRAVSSKGAKGLMQLMPGTWAAMRAEHSLGNDMFDPRDNILAGAAYLRAMHDRFGYPGLFAAYNAGPGRYEESLRGRPLPVETVAYLAAVTGRIAVPDPARTPQDGGGPNLFIIRSGAVLTPRSDAGALFFPLTSKGQGEPG